MGPLSSRAKKEMTYQLGVLAGRQQRLDNAVRDKGAADYADLAVRNEADALYEQLLRCLEQLDGYQQSVPRRFVAESEQLKATLVARASILGAALGKSDDVLDVLERGDDDAT